MATSAVMEEQILKALRAVRDPDLHRDIVSLGFVQNIAVCDGRVKLDLVLTTPACPVRDEMKEQARLAVLSVPGVREVHIELKSDVRRGIRGNLEEWLPGVRNFVGVASGKGGVGKSTVALNLALALAQKGARVGLLDADVYGPSIPPMMGFRESPPLYMSGDRALPVEKDGIKMMSLGFFMDETTQPVLWRGPMIHSYIQQMLRDVDWGELDYLLVDLPPGTGDAQITLSQSVPLTGAVIVMTAQEVAVKIATKALRMFQVMNVPVLGIVENMSSFICPHCGEETPIFQKGGGQKAAESLGVPFLGSIPLAPKICESGDRGKPVVLSDPDSPEAKAFAQIASNIAAQVSVLALTKKS